MKILNNGVYRDMTPEEERAIEEERKAIALPPIDPTEQRMQDLEAENREIKAMLKKLTEV